jgi:nucleotide-binding universal stress UspA family protein
MRILFATDLSSSADDAAQLVASLAWPDGTLIRVLGVIEPLATVLALAPEAMSALYDENAQREFATAVAVVGAGLRTPSVTVETVTAVGRPADVIVEEAERSGVDLVVIGSRGRGAIRSALLGSVSAEVVDRAPCPVLVARRDRVTKIVFGEDGSHRTREAARILRWPIFASLPIRVVTTAEVALPYEAVTEDRAVFEQAVRDYLEAARAARARASGVEAESVARLIADGLAATGEIREGAAAAGIMSAAESFDADLIIVGSRGDRGFTRLIVGSTAREVLYHTGCSILVARQTTTVPEKTKPEPELAGVAAAT